MELKSTRLRYMRASDLDVLMAAVEGLPFKVEIKGQPVKDGKKWVLFFVLPETPGIKMGNNDLT